MDGFAQFAPIKENIREEASKYYSENNIPMPDNTYFAEFLQEPISGSPLDEFSTFYAGKKTGSKGKKATKPIAKTPKTKINMPEFTEWKKGLKPSLPKDYTVQRLLDKSDTKYEGKQNFLSELDALNINDEDKVYLTKLAQKESSFRPNIPNQLGYFGYYQFGQSALKAVGKTKKDFADPKIQHKSALKLADQNMIPLQKYIGKTINGIELTKNNLRAAAHLAGASGTKDWIEGTKKTDFAKRGFIDANGTHITQYLKEFLV